VCPCRRVILSRDCIVCPFLRHLLSNSADPKNAQINRLRPQTDLQLPILYLRRITLQTVANLRTIYYHISSFIGLILPCEHLILISNLKQRHFLHDSVRALSFPESFLDLVTHISFTRGRFARSCGRLDLNATLLKDVKIPHIKAPANQLDLRHRAAPSLGLSAG